MPFEFISSAANIARQQQIWGLVIGCVGIVILGYALSKGRPLAVTMAGLVLTGVGVFYLWQANRLAAGAGQWIVRADTDKISWQSPDQKSDPSFVVGLTEISYIHRSAKQSRGEEGAVYHLMMKDDTVIKLRDISGIDLDQFAEALTSTGLEIRENELFYKPQELRNR